MTIVLVLFAVVKKEKENVSPVDEGKISSTALELILDKIVSHVLRETWSSRHFLVASQESSENQEALIGLIRSDLLIFVPSIE